MYPMDPLAMSLILMFGLKKGDKEIDRALLPILLMCSCGQNVMPPQCTCNPPSTTTTAPPPPVVTTQQPCPPPCGGSSLFNAFLMFALLRGVGSEGWTKAA
jgi:hypothetical protein